MCRAVKFIITYHLLIFPRILHNILQPIFELARLFGYGVPSNIYSSNH